MFLWHINVNWGAGEHMAGLKFLDLRKIEVYVWFRILYDWELHGLCVSLSVVSQAELVCTWLEWGSGACT